jgi:endonuclease/exonuclease/phosphatase family metal-dependent hydrolase
MTLNVRYDNPADAPNDWDSRKPIIIQTILEKSADIIGLQEVLAGQLDDLDSLLPWYDYIGVGREDGKSKGEHCPVFYKMNRFEALDYGTFWLSETPLDTGSTGWDAALPRIATWVRFRDMHMQRKGQFLEFYFINTHFDHMGDTARKQSAQLIMDFIQENTKGERVVLAGDFNAVPTSLPYEIITGGHGSNLALIDACGVAPGKETVITGTYNGFGQVNGSRRIDFIFTSTDWDILTCETLKVIMDGVYISDHYPVISRIKINSFQ